MSSLQKSYPSTDAGPVIAKVPTNGRKEVSYHALYESSGTPKNGYSGVMATLDVYSFPNLKKPEVSAVMVRVSNYPSESNRTGLNDIQVGWAVDPTTYGDSKTHFFVSWTADYYDKTGCFNLDCDGFVPVNGAPVTPGDALEQANNQTKITFKIFKDENDGDWWLYFGYDVNNLSRVRFWPKSIFNRIGWEGFTHSYIGWKSPPMGNGRFPGKMSASIQNVQYVDTDGRPYAPPVWPIGLEVYVTSTRCYQASNFENNMFYDYGGPGGCTNDFW